MSSVAVLGPGGVGGFIAGALARAEQDVVVIAREPTAALIADQGLDVRSVRLGDFVSRPDASSTLTRPIDVLLVATKATGLEPALQRVQAEPALVVPLLNGLDHMAVLRERFGPRVAAGTIRIESDRPSPGRIVHTSPFLRVDVASEDPALRPALEQFCATLQTAGIPAELGCNEKQILWSKLVRLCAIACTTSAADRPIGEIRNDPHWRALLEGAVSEAAAVANADGAAIDGAARLAEIDDVHPELTSSMQRDIAAGREPELDAIAGAVLRAGKRHGVDCPTIEHLYALIAQRAGKSAT